MKINKEIAQQIFDKTRDILNMHLAITDDRGIVLAGGRPGDFDLYSYQAINQRRITEEKGEKVVTWSPLYYEGQAVGSFSISGSLSEVTQETIDLVQGLSQVLIYQGMLLEKLYSLDRARAGFIREILMGGSIKSEDQAGEQADILRLNLRANQAIILAHVSGFQENYLASLNNFSPEEKVIKFEEYISSMLRKIEEAFDGNDQNVVVYFGHNIFLILKGIRGGKVTTENSVKFFLKKGKYLHEVIKNITEGEVTIGIGQFYPGFEGLKKSFNDAKLALEIGAKIWGLGKDYHILDVGIFVSLASISHQRKAELSNQLLHPLLENGELKKTVEIFYGYYFGIKFPRCQSAIDKSI
ncbi:MAG: Transcriptional regulator, CdaR [Parcubacteria group bacterium GW2011_GWA1_42_7]|nr:MAG: Transcriptional regulator, CdaR [Parcubacteria group bacterium GW2011_GWA1_42_7]